MALLQIMSLILSCLIVLLLVIERARRKYFRLMDSVNLVRERNRKLQMDVEDIFGIYEGVRGVIATLNIDDILRGMGQMMNKFFDFSEARLCLLCEQDGGACINLQYDFKLRSISREKVEIEEERMKGVIAQKNPVLFPTQDEVRNLTEDAEMPDIFMIVPLKVEDKVIGVIEMEREGEPFLPFSPDDLHKLSILCAQTSVVLRRAGLYMEVERLAIMDGLTGLFVHRYFQDKLVSELKRTEAYGGSFSLLMADIDYFKRYNDRYGHLVGDELLRRVARAIKDGVRETDIVARYGGEEFAVILLHRGKKEALKAAEEIRARIKSLKLKVEGKETGVTISIGIAAYPQDGLTADDIINWADEAMYKAKEGGRNQVVVCKK